MSDRFTNRDQVRLVELLHRELVRAGIIPESTRLVLQAGSPTRRAWRLHCIADGTSGEWGVCGLRDYLGEPGMTRAVH